MKENDEKILELVKKELTETNVSRIYNSISDDNTTDVKFFISQYYDTTSVRDSGDISVILTDEIQPKTSIWLKDKHIASGYGFNTLADKLAVEELMANPKLQELLESTTNTNPETNPSEDDPSSSISILSSINLDDAELTISDEGISAESFIKIYDLKFFINKLINLKNYIPLGGKISLPVNLDFDIRTIKMRYTYTSTSNKTLKYLLSVSNTELDEQYFLNQRSNYITIDNLVDTGVKSDIDIPISNVTVKSTDNKNEKFYIYFAVMNQDNTKLVYYKVCEINLLLPIFALEGDYNIDTVSLITLPDESIIFDEPEKIIITINRLEKYHYICVPTEIIDKVRIILEQSNIKADFTEKYVGLLQDKYNYTILESPNPYNGNVDWVIEYLN